MNLEIVPDDVGSVPVGEHGNRRALPGFSWLCAACGKRSHDRYGDERIDPRWDESCILNAVLIKVTT